MPFTLNSPIFGQIKYDSTTNPNGLSNDNLQLLINALNSSPTTESYLTRTLHKNPTPSFWHNVELK